ncbi:hypothetical protein GALMADRAFT_212330 [Galerina marginata CBS 339.88]|uniref:AMP-dependent synthetase/ligase domain-containing protein n=1 Tax=Galerina marginata (strain CBS 339.88) TaxID=685588 RepID=A0A067T326_GALM3|nr:hypothetical protein GALMADRAFT_212330 [Galerina marginata CBS 339.88]
MALADYLLTDDLTILLALIAATVFLLNNLYRPQPLVHPILLGRQSDVGRARNPGESAVYRNYGTGLMGRADLYQFPLRPGKDVHILADFVRPEMEAPRTLWSTKLTNSHLQDRAAAFATGLLRLGRIQPQKSTVLLLLNDCLEFIVADLALASHSISSITLSSSKLLSPVLDAHPPSAIVTHAFLLPQLLELIYDSSEHQTEHTIIVVGEPTPQAMASVASNVKVYKFAELEREGFKVEKILSPLPKPSDIFTVSFYETESGQIHGAQLTHENMTAGVAAVRAMFPLTSGMSPLDTLVSAHSMSTAYGRAIAYTAIYEGTSFASIQSSELYYADENDVKTENAQVVAARKYPIPSPTVLFLKPTHLASLVSGIIAEGKSSSWFLYSFAWRHKLAGVNDGFITNQSLWDRLVFDSARAKVLGNGAATLREIIVSGGHIDLETLTPARIALSVPLVNVFTHPLVAAPILASNPLDLQDLPSFSTGKTGSMAHSGPPGVNVEVKLVGVNDEIVENGGDPIGDVLVRGPPVGKLVVNLEDYVDVPRGTTSDSDADAEAADGWTATEAKARVQTNGAFQLIA